MSILYLAAVASAITLVPTHPDQPRQAQVAYDDLNLSSSEGQQRLDRRLQIALNMVCGNRRGASLREFGRVNKCRKQAMAEIAPQRQAAIANADGVKVAGRF